MGFILKLFTWKGFGIVALVCSILTGLYFLWEFFWFRPQEWNGTAMRYYTQVNALVRDTTSLQIKGRRDDSIILKRDNQIAVYQIDSAKAYKYADSVQTLLLTTRRQSDETVDMLSDSIARINYLRNLIGLGALNRPLLSIPTLQPNTPDVVKAGLKVTNWQQINEKVISTLSNSVGRYKTSTDRANKSTGVAIAGIDKTTKRAQQGSKKGFWVFKKNLRRLANDVVKTNEETKANIKQVQTGELDLEQELNKPKQ